MKILSKEISIIILGSVLLAFGFNAFRAKPMPLIYKKEKPIEFTEAELFGDIPQSVDATLIKNNETTLVDTSKQVNQQIIAQNAETPKIESIPKVADNNADASLLKTVTYKQMLQIISNDNFFIIDARSAENYNKAHIGNAVNIFPYDEESVVVQKIFELPQNKKIVIYCDGGQCDSSHELAKMIINFGFKNVYLYAGGWEEWSELYGK